MTFILNKENSIANQYFKEVRDLNQQKDQRRFRENLERLGELLAYEISRTFKFETISVPTSQGNAEINVPVDQVVLVPVLRAALPFYLGFLRIFSLSETGFIGASRASEGEKDQIEISMSYSASPDLTGKTLILIDPMLATGKSFEKSVRNLLLKGKPEKIHLAAVVAAPEGISYLEEQLKDIGYSLWIGALDKKLDEKSYIVPGLGDAGDLSFGKKI